MIRVSKAEIWEMKEVKFGKRTHYTLFALLLLLNIILRYPCTPHELGADSFFIHSLGNSISVHGHAQWLLHTLSLFGLYPFSYASGVPFFISSFSQLAGSNLELTILVVATIFGLLSLFTSYLMAGAIWDDDRFKFLVAFGYSLSPLLLKFTIWTMSTRGLFIVLLPIFLWSLFKGHDSKGTIKKWKYYILSFVLLIVLAVIHRMFLIAVLLCIVFLLTILLYNHGGKALTYKKYKSVLKPISIMPLLFTSFVFFLVLIAFWFTSLFEGGFWEILVSNKIVIFLALLLSEFISILLLIFKRENKSIRNFSSLNLILLIPTMFLIQFTSLTLTTMHPWWLRASSVAYLLPYGGITLKSDFLNFGVLLGARLGLLLIFAVIGLFYIIWNGKLDYKKTFFIIISITFLPFFREIPYLHEAFGFIYYIFSGFAIVALFEGLKHVDKFNFKRTPVHLMLSKKQVPAIAVILILTFSILFSGYTVIHRYTNIGVGDTRNYMMDATQNAGLFIKFYSSNIEVTGIDISRIKAVSEREPFSINRGNVHIVPKKLPPITDFWGWYCYFKSPFECIQFMQRDYNEFLYFGYTHVPSYHQDGNKICNKVYCNGKGNIWHFKEHTWRYLSLE